MMHHQEVRRTGSSANSGNQRAWQAVRGHHRARGLVRGFAAPLRLRS